MSISITATLNHNALANQVLGLNDAKGNAFGVRPKSPPAAPAHATGGGGTFCTRWCMYVSPRMKILGWGRGAAAPPSRCRKQGAGWIAFAPCAWGVAGRVLHPHLPRLLRLQEARPEKAIY